MVQTACASKVAQHGRFHALSSSGAKPLEHTLNAVIDLSGNSYIFGFHSHLLKFFLELFVIRKFDHNAQIPTSWS